MRSKDRDSDVDVVVEFDVVFARVGAQEATDVMNDSASEREREREEQGIELGPVESLAEVRAGGDQHDACVGCTISDRFTNCGARLLAKFAA